MSVVDVLCELIARHGHLRRIAPPLLLAVWAQVRKIAVETEALLARLRAGTLRRHPSRRPAARATRRRATPPPTRRNRNWLLDLIPETAATASHLRFLLEEPDIPALLAAAPQLRRKLRPLCHALGVDLPATPTPPNAAPPAIAPPDPVSVDAARPATPLSRPQPPPIRRDGAADPGHGPRNARTPRPVARAGP